MPLPLRFPEEALPQILKFKYDLAKKRQKFTESDDMYDYYSKISTIDDILEMLDQKPKRKGYEIVEGQKKILYEPPKTFEDLLKKSIELGIPLKNIPKPVTAKPMDIKSSITKDVLSEWNFEYDPAKSYTENLATVYQQLSPDEKQEFLKETREALATLQPRKQKKQKESADLSQILKIDEFKKVAGKYGYRWDEEKGLADNLNAVVNSLAPEERGNFIREVYKTRDKIKKVIKPPDEETIQNKLDKLAQSISTLTDKQEKILNKYFEKLGLGDVGEFPYKSVDEIKADDELPEGYKQEAIKTLKRIKKLQKRIELKKERAKEELQMLPEATREKYYDIFDFKGFDTEPEESATGVAIGTEAIKQPPRTAEEYLRKLGIQ
jgi:hypothetical protein